MKKIAADRNYKLFKEAGKQRSVEQQRSAARQSASDIEPSAEVLAAALKAIGGTIPRMSYQVTERDVRVILSELYRAGYSLVKGSSVSYANDHLLSGVENFVGPMPPKSKIPISFDEKGITVSKDNKSLTFDPISKSISGRVERKLTPNLSIEGKGYSSKGHHKADVSLKGKF